MGTEDHAHHHRQRRPGSGSCATSAWCAASPCARAAWSATSPAASSRCSAASSRSSSSWPRRARQEAFDHLIEHATAAGANAVIAMRYDANEIMDGITEVLAYGTAVVMED